MSGDFWLGLAALPIAAALIALLAFAVYGLFFIVWKNEYVIGPKRNLGSHPHFDKSGQIQGRARVLLAVADMGHVHRILYFYGWTILIGRQTKPAPRGQRLPETNKRIPFVAALEEHYEVEA